MIGNLYFKGVTKLKGVVTLLKYVLTSIYETLLEFNPTWYVVLVYNKMIAKSFIV